MAIGIRVTATDTGPGTPLSVTDTFFINVVPLNTPPVAVNNSYTTLENVGLSVLASNSVLFNDTDPNGNPFTAAVVTGPANGRLLKTDGTPGINPNGSFDYIPNINFFGTDTFTYQDTDSALGVSNLATVTILVNKNNVPVTEHLVQDTGISATDFITKNPTIAGTGNSNASVSGTIDPSTINATSFTTTADATGAWSFTPTLADGPHTVVVTETNVLSTTTPPANTTATLTFTLDTTPPVVTEKLVSDTGSLATDNITSNPALSGTGDPNAAVLVSIDGAAAVSVPTDATGIWTLTPVLADGTHTVVATETDTAGNIGTSSFTFTLDTKAPPVTVALVSDTGISATDGITSNPALTGTGDPNAAVLISIDGGVAVSVATDANGKWTFTPAVANGQYKVQVTETDLAGNVGTSSLAFTLDTIAPATPVLGPFTFTASKNTLNGYTFSGKAEPFSSVALSNGLVTTAATTGTFNLQGTSRANIQSTITATATDLAGNVSTPTSAVGLIIAVLDGATLKAAGNTPNLMLALGNNDTLIGGGGNDTFFATVGGGKNILTGGGGTDTYDLSRTPAGTNIVNLGIGGKGTAAIAGGGTDTLNNFQNVIGGSGTNNITGNGAGSVLTGGGVGSTNILKDGNPANGNGSATMIGNSANDQFFVNSAKDQVTENFVGGINDTVFTTLSSYTLGANLEVLKFLSPTGGVGTGTFTATGNNLNDTIVGGNGVNTLAAGTGNTVLIGGNSNDVLISGTGDDRMTGGLGNDIFKFLPKFGNDIIMDFTAHGGIANNKDLIDLTGLGITSANSQTSFANSVTFKNDGVGNTFVTVSRGGTADGSIKLLHVVSSALNSTDFRLA